MNSWGIGASAYGTSRAAPASDKLRTAQLHAPRSNSIIALEDATSNSPAIFIQAHRPFFGRPWKKFLERRLLRAVNNQYRVRTTSHGGSGPSLISISAALTPLPDLPCRHHEPRSAVHRQATAAARPWLRPTAHASIRRALRRWSGSPALPSDGWARRSRSAPSSGSRRRDADPGSASTWYRGRL